MNLITDFTVKPGEVIYIGDLEVDTRNTNILIHAMKIRSYKKENYIYSYDNFPLVYKKKFIGLTKCAEAAKVIPAFE